MSRKQYLMPSMIKRVGMRKALRAMGFIVAWESAQQMVATEDPGAHFGIERYIVYWKMSKATAYREQAAFREAVPGFDSPTDLIAEARRQKVSVQEVVLP